MKIKSMMLAALTASMTFVACNNDDSGDFLPDQAPKSVTIKLPNIQPEPSRATGNAIQGSSKVELSNFKVFFVDASGNEVTVPQYNSQDQKVFFQNTDGDWATVTTPSNELTFHFLPSNTSKVVVVGNIGDVAYSTLATRVDNVPNDAPAHPSYPLYGESALTISGAVDVGGHNNVYQASVTLTPRVSRFEIYGFEYAGSAYTSVTLKKIALNNYYTQSEFVSKNPSGSPVYEDVSASTAWDWIEQSAAPWADALTLTLNAGEKKFVDGTAISDPAEDGEGATNIVTYGLAHISDAQQNPELLLALTGTNGATETPLYLRGKFTNESAFESGKIYRVLYSFNDSNLEQPERCVELTVSVSQWTVVPVTPEF